MSAYRKAAAQSEPEPRLPVVQVRASATNTPPARTPGERFYRLPFDRQLEAARELVSWLIAKGEALEKPVMLRAELPWLSDDAVCAGASIDGGRWLPAATLDELRNALRKLECRGRLGTGAQILSDLWLTVHRRTRL